MERKDKKQIFVLNKESLLNFIFTKNTGKNFTRIF